MKKKHNFWRVGKMMVLFLAVSGLTFMKFGDDVGDPVLSKALSQLSLWCSSLEILILKIAIELRSCRK